MKSVNVNGQVKFYYGFIKSLWYYIKKKFTRIRNGEKIMGVKIGYIGVGNIGNPLVKGLVKSGTARPEDVYIYDVDSSRMEELVKETGVTPCENNIQLVRECDYIVLAIKPIFVRQVLEEIRDVFTKDKVLVSIVVGVTTNTLRSILYDDAKVVRAIPNLPVMVGEGMTLIHFPKNISQGEKKIAKSIFESCGKVDELDESLMSEVTSLTSSSPAYVFLLIEAMGDGAVQNGLPRRIAYKLAAQAVLGSAKMVLETKLHPAELKDQVCSPAGTTIEAVYTLEKNGFRHLIMEAMMACTRRALEIAREC